VPMIIVPPKNFNGSVNLEMRCERPVNLLDLYPTLVDICSLPKKKDLDGNSILPLVYKPQQNWKKVTVTTLGRGSNAITDGEWKYIHYFDGNEELYNLKKDRWEWDNLARNPEYQAKIKYFKKHVIDDPDIRHYIRMNQWKAVVKETGEVMLFDIYGTNGISEQMDVAQDHPEIIREIKKRLKNKSASSKYMKM